jgi:hypothetical protein
VTSSRWSLARLLAIWQPYGILIVTRFVAIRLTIRDTWLNTQFLNQLLRVQTMRHLICLALSLFAVAAHAAAQNDASNSLYSGWLNGPSTAPGYFPLGVYLQSTRRIGAFRDIGMNLYIRISDGTDEKNLAVLAENKMPLIVEQNRTTLSSAYQSMIVGWLQPDEPDNAQPNGHRGYSTCVPPSQVVTAYDMLKAADPSRPVQLNFGRGVADEHWLGRHDCAGQTTSYYPPAIVGGDIISFDIYPVASYHGRLELIARGLDNLYAWIAVSGHSKIVWNVIEAAPISNGDVPTPAQMRAEVWMSIIHGSQGIIYFVHEFNAAGDQLIREDGIFNFPALASAVKAINAEITSLALVLHSPNVLHEVTVSGPDGGPIDTMVRRYHDMTYLFAVCMRLTCGTAQFTLQEPSGTSAEVLNENRTLRVVNGVFHDDFANYGVHLYRLTDPSITKDRQGSAMQAR